MTPNDTKWNRALILRTLALIRTEIDAAERIAADTEVMATASYCDEYSISGIGGTPEAARRGPLRYHVQTRVDALWVDLAARLESVVFLANQLKTPPLDSPSQSG